MKRSHIATIISVLFLVVSVFARNPMIEKKEKVEVKADPANAVLVIYRTKSVGSGAEVKVFVDQKYIGTSVGKC